jgi:DNA polymerase elongation subunit (family B)
MESFIECIKTLGNADIYFHNLSFDGEFILWWLLENEYEYDEQLSRDRTFKSVIDETGSIYTIDIYFNSKCKITFKCSYKLFPKSISDIGKLVGIKKLNETHNYQEIKNYHSIDELPEEEIKYITNDVRIMVELIKYLQEKGVKGITMSSSAYKNWQQEKYMLAHNEMKKDSNEEIVEIVRKSYRGGITKVNPNYAGIEFNDVISFDVNSLYPSVMYENPMPIGEGKIYKSVEEGRKDNRYLFIVVAFVQYAKVRDGMHAFIGNTSGFSYARKYSYDDVLENKMIYLWLDEYRLFELVYDAQVEILKVVGWKKANNVFTNYIDRWYKVKENARNDVERSLAKLMLNSLYGKFGMNDNRITKLPVAIGDKIIYRLVDNNTTYYYKEVASYITSKARCKLASFMNRCGDKFLYCDTDSVYYIGHEIPEIFKDVVDPKKLGYWKYEGHYTRFKALKAKCYLKQLDDGTIERRIAGCPKECAELINFDNFAPNLKLSNAKRCKKKVKGAIVIGNTDFTINI